MNFSLAAAILAPSLLPLFAPTATADAPAADRRALQLAQRYQKAKQGFQAEQGELEMVLIDPHGRRTTRRLKVRTKEIPRDGPRSIILLEGAPEVAGTHLMTWTRRHGDDVHWLYLPTINRLWRIGGAHQRSAFAGSELSYEDLAGDEVTKFTHRFLGAERIDDRAAWKLERVPLSPHSAYGRQVVWLDQRRLVPLRIDGYDRGGGLFKTTTFSGYSLFRRWWRARELRILNHHSLHRTLLVWHKRELGDDVSDEGFDRVTLADWILTNAVIKAPPVAAQARSQDVRGPPEGRR